MIIIQYLLNLLEKSNNSKANVKQKRNGYYRHFFLYFLNLPHIKVAY